MSERTQVNFRIDTELLTAIKQKCSELGCSTSEFFINAAKAALGMKTMERTNLSNSEAFLSLTTRLVEVENRLVDSLASKERLAELEKQLTEALKNIDDRIAEQVRLGIEQEALACLGESPT